MAESFPVATNESSVQQSLKAQKLVVLDLCSQGEGEAMLQLWEFTGLHVPIRMIRV